MKHRIAPALVAAILFLFIPSTTVSATPQAPSNFLELVDRVCPDVLDMRPLYRGPLAVDMDHIKWMGGIGKLPQPSFACPKNRPIAVFQGTADGGPNWTVVDQWCLDARRAKAVHAVKWGYAAQGSNTEGTGAAMWCEDESATLQTWGEAKAQQGVMLQRFEEVDSQIRVINTRLDDHADRIRTVEDKVDNQEQRLAKVENAFDPYGGPIAFVLPGVLTSDMLLGANFFWSDRWGLYLNGHVGSPLPHDGLWSGGFSAGITRSVTDKLNLSFGGLYHQAFVFPVEGRHTTAAVLLEADFRPTKLHTAEDGGAAICFGLLAGGVAEQRYAWQPGLGATLGIRWTR